MLKLNFLLWFAHHSSVALPDDIHSESSVDLAKCSHFLKNTLLKDCKPLPSVSFNQVQGHILNNESESGDYNPNTTFCLSLPWRIKSIQVSPLLMVSVLTKQRNTIRTDIENRRMFK